MISIEEISAWSVKQALAEVYTSLPSGWKFRCVVNDGFYVGFIDDDKGDLQWESDPTVDQKIAVLDAYGWLFARQHAPKHPRWVPREDITPESVNARLGLVPPSRRSQGMADPGDLDPQEVERVLFKNR